MIKTNLPARAEDRPPRVIIKPVRRDGKHPVTYIYPGAPNMFGGYEHSRSYNKLRTADEIQGSIRPWYDVQDDSQGTYRPTEVQE